MKGRKTNLVAIFFTLLILVNSCKSDDGAITPPVPLTPEITSIEPDSGRFGDLITITGLNFRSTPPNNTVTINGLQALITETSNTRLIAEVPKGAGSGPLQVTINGDTTTVVEFTYILRPVVETVAGTGVAGFVDDQGLGAQFNLPHGIFLRRDGSLLIADRDNNAIRTFSNGLVITLAIGSATIEPVDIIEISTEQILITNLQTSLLFSVTPNEEAIFKSIAGVRQGLNRPLGMRTNNRGNSLFVTDRSNHVIHRIGLQYKESTVVAGTPGDPGFEDGNESQSRLNQPYFTESVLTPQETDLLYFSEQGNHAIRATEFGEFPLTFTVAGNGEPGFVDGPGNQAQFNSPRGLALDNSGNLLVADFRNNAIRMISPTGEVSTLIQSVGEVSATAEPRLIDGPDGVAQFNGPYGLDVAVDGTIYVSDVFHHAIRKITFE